MRRDLCIKVVGDKLFVRVVYEDKPSPEMIQSQIAPDVVDDRALVHDGMRAFLKVFDDIKIRDDAALHLSAQKTPDILVIDEGEFNKRVAEHEAIRQRHKRIGKLFESGVEEKRP